MKSKQNILIVNIKCFDCPEMQFFSEFWIVRIAFIYLFSSILEQKKFQNHKTSPKTKKKNPVCAQHYNGCQISSIESGTFTCSGSEGTMVLPFQEAFHLKFHSIQARQQRSWVCFHCSLKYFFFLALSGIVMFLTFL